jgi:RHS repeat-associated protein
MASFSSFGQVFEVDKIPTFAGGIDETLTSQNAFQKLACEQRANGKQGNGVVGLAVTISTAPYTSAGFSLIGINSNNACGQTAWLVSKPWACPAGYTSVSGAPTKCKRSGLDPAKNNQCDESSCDVTGPVTVGNPVNYFTGAKLQKVVDFSTGASRLELVRYYTSARPIADGGQGFGRLWRHTYMRSILHMGTATAGTVLIERPGGNAYYFKADSSGNWLAEADVSFKLEALIYNDVLSGWKVTDPAGNREQYDASGRIVRADYINGDFVDLAYNGSGQLTSVTDDRGRVLAFTYNGALVTAVTTPDGSAISYLYDSKKRLEQVLHSGVMSEKYLYESTSLPGSLTGVLDAQSSRLSTWTYDTSGRVVSMYRGASGSGVGGFSFVYGAGSTSVTSPSGGAVSYTYASAFGRAKLATAQGFCMSCGGQTNQSRLYGASGHLASTVGFNGAATEYAFNGRGLNEIRLEAAGDPVFERKTETTWHSVLPVALSRQVSNAADQLVSESTWDLNLRGQVLMATSTDPGNSASRITSMEYCESAGVSTGVCPRIGLLLEVDGARTDVADVTTYEYRASDHPACGSSPSSCPFRKGDIWKVTNAVGQTSEVMAYDGAGRQIEVKDPNGITTETQYHPRGWVSGVTVKGATTAEDRSTSYEYWPTGLVKKVTAPDGVFTSFEYDDAHRLKAIADSAGNRIEYTLDGAGNRIAENTKGSGGALKRTLSRVYNTLGQLATQADAQANPTDFTYDAVGNAKTVTDALGHVTSNDYDPLNRLKRTLQDVGGIEAETKFEYDANDNLTKVTDPKGLDTTYTYNGFGDQVQLSSPDTGITTFTYDSAGNRASQTDARGITTTYQYDALNRLTQVGYPTSSLNVSYTYDVTQPVCQAGETFSVGRLTLMVDGSGSTQYCHDRFGQLVRKVQTTNGVALTLQYAYTKGGQLQAMTYPDGTVVDYLRNAQGQITEVGVAQPSQAREVLLTQATYHPFGPIAGWVYGNGRVMQRNVDLDYRPRSIQGGPGGLDLTYGYDAVGNLTSLSSGSPPPLEYGYDALGRLTESRDGPTQAIIDQYTYDKTGNRTSFTDSLGTKAYAYPSTSHRLSSVAGENRTYDAVGNTLSIGASRAFSYSDAGRLSSVELGGITSMQYVYNGRGERLRKHLGAAETLSLYDEAGHWLGDYPSTGGISRQLILMDGAPVGALYATKLYYLQTDHLGAPRAVVDQPRNAVIWGWDSKGEAFGNTWPAEDVDGDGVSFVLDMRFPGQRSDAAGGLYYNYFRDLDPDAGRYVESDPIGLSGGISTYSYVAGSPLMRIDPLGLACKSVAGVTRCEYPNGPIFVLPTPPGFQDFDGSELLYHRYDIKRDLDCASPIDVMNALVNNPTPSPYARPATPQGTTLNDASVVGSGNNLVTSYLTTDLSTGNPLVVNITAPGSMFSPGYVARTVNNGVAHTYGEGANWSQHDKSITGALINKLANELVWGRQMKKLIEGSAQRCGCQ